MSLAAPWSILVGDALEQLRGLPDNSVDCVVTSPPYWGLRDYGLPPTAWPAVMYRVMGTTVEVPAMDACLGLEAELSAFIGHLVLIFREVHRVLKPTGTVWVNMGDCYITKPHGRGSAFDPRYPNGRVRVADKANRGPQSGLKHKDLSGQPWRLALTLQEEGWFLRRDIVWHKPSPMPESCVDRPTTAHEYVFLFSKRATYYYNAAAIREPVTGTAHPRGAGVNPKAVAGWANGDGDHSAIGHNQQQEGAVDKTAGRADAGLKTGDRLGRSAGWRVRQNPSMSAALAGIPDTAWRNARSVWRIPAQPYRGAHFATYPEELARRCIVAGSPLGGVVLDPFLGSGTTGAVAMSTGRQFVGIELNPQYAALAHARITVAASQGRQLDLLEGTP